MIGINLWEIHSMLQTEGSLQVSPALFFMETQPHRSEGEIPCRQDAGKLRRSVVDSFFLLVFQECKFSCFTGGV